MIRLKVDRDQLRAALRDDAEVKAPPVLDKMAAGIQALVRDIERMHESKDKPQGRFVELDALFPHYPRCDC